MSNLIFHRFHLGALVLAGLLLLGIQGDVKASGSKAVLARAVVCAGIENFLPVTPAAVFSISQGEVYCFSSFDPVLERTQIYHKWYKRDQLIFTMRLVLTPPRWSSFSRIQIRDADKGPWRVEIQEEDGTVLETLRFSMAD